jgi:hypothetical protein
MKMDADERSCSSPSSVANGSPPAVASASGLDRVPNG